MNTFCGVVWFLCGRKNDRKTTEQKKKQYRLPFGNASKEIKDIFVKIIWSLLMKLNVPNKEIIVYKYEDIYKEEKLSNFIYKYWGDRKMLRTFPNLKIQDIDGNMIYMDSLLSDIQPYYYKFHFKK